MKKLLSLLSLITITALSIPQASAIHLSNRSNHQVIMHIPGADIISIPARMQIIVNNPETISADQAANLRITINNQRYEFRPENRQTIVGLAHPPRLIYTAGLAFIVNIENNLLTINAIVINMPMENSPGIRVEYTNAMGRLYQTNLMSVDTIADYGT